ncbi:PfkB family carbohydrate kinase [Saccharothrix xinjiangensis]|uniref:PfkB family carbohydrate kinase n=1 Tax=Saccharothrix xinjiangensis TaxID=204798 RepID=A0ABV9Y5S4_9PSEU
MLCVGLTTVDVSQLVAEFPLPGQKVQSLGVDLAPGGPAANAARAVAALGHRAVLLTSLGGELGGFARERLRPVEVRSVGAGGPALSMVVVRERDGERTVVSRNAAGFDGAAGDGSVDAEVHAEVGAAVGEADVVLVDGHLGPLALAAARLARRRGVPVVLDAGSWKPVLDDLLPLVDVAACAEGFELSEREVHDRGVPLVIRTHGPRPVTWSRGGATGSQPVPVVEVRDTNGAGDVWHGALAVAVARGDETADAVRWANEVAAVRVRNTAWDWVEELGRWRDRR